MATVQKDKEFRASSDGNRNGENVTSHLGRTSTIFMQKGELAALAYLPESLMPLPTCLNCVSALLIGTFPLGLSRNIMIQDACDDFPACCQESKTGGAKCCL
jgi:hypothetical protein